MSHIRLPKGHGPVTVSLLLPILSLASSLAFRPSPVTATAEAPAAGAATVDAAPELADVASCAAETHECAAPGAAPRRVVLVKLATRAAGSPAAALPATPASPEFAFQIASAMAAPANEGFRLAGFAYTTDDDMPILLVDPRRGESWGSWNSGDDRAARRLRKTEKARFLWFRHEGREYVIRDPALLDRAGEIVEPQTELGRSQGELGGVQGSVGGEQGRLGARQGAYGAQIGALARREARIQSRLHLRSLSASEAQRLEAELDEIREERQRLSEAMSALSEGQARMAARQAKLAARQAEFARRQAELSKVVSRELKALVREALRNGKAVRLASETY